MQTVRKKRRVAPDVRIIVSPSPAQIDESARRLLARGRGSMGFILGDADTRYRLLSSSLRWQQVILALDGNRAIGFASFKCRGRGGPYAPSLKDFLKIHGWSTLWRYPAFLLSESRDAGSGFYLYGVKVDKRYRGHGVSKILLDAIHEEARRRKADYIDLEVTNKHGRAQQIYERYGYKLLKTRRLGWLGKFFSFSSVDVMRLTLK